MKAKEMIYKLRLIEAQRWENVKAREELCILICGTDKQDDWDDTSRNILSRYITEWYSVSEILKELDLEPFGWSERKELKEKKIIK